MIVIFISNFAIHLRCFKVLDVLFVLNGIFTFPGKNAIGTVLKLYSNVPEYITPFLRE